MPLVLPGIEVSARDWHASKAAQGQKPEAQGAETMKVAEHTEEGAYQVAASAAPFLSYSTAHVPTSWIGTDFQDEISDRAARLGHVTPPQEDDSPVMQSPALQSPAAGEPFSPQDASARPPRPQNAWLLYRNDRLSLLDAADAKRPQGELSKAIAAAWKSEPTQIKKAYEQAAKQRKAQHDLLYPDYRYLPAKRKGGKDKWQNIQSPQRTPRRAKSKRGRAATVEPSGVDVDAEMRSPEIAERKTLRQRSKTVPAQAVTVTPFGGNATAEAPSAARAIPPPLDLQQDSMSRRNMTISEWQAQVQVEEGANAADYPLPPATSSLLPRHMLSAVGSSISGMDSTPHSLASSQSLAFPQPSPLMTSLPLSSASYPNEQDRSSRADALGFILPEAPGVTAYKQMQADLFAYHSAPLTSDPMSAPLQPRQPFFSPTSAPPLPHSAPLYSAGNLFDPSSSSSLRMPSPLFHESNLHSSYEGTPYTDASPVSYDLPTTLAPSPAFTPAWWPYRHLRIKPDESGIPLEEFLSKLESPSLTSSSSMLQPAISGLA